MAGPFLFDMVDATGDSKRLQGKETFFQLGQKNAAPDLVPRGHTGTPGSQQIIPIDVINDFRWTQTPSMGRHEVPFIRLSESRIQFNSLVQNIKYQLTIGSEMIKGGMDFIDDTAGRYGIDLKTPSEFLEGSEAERASKKNLERLKGQDTFDDAQKRHNEKYPGTGFLSDVKSNLNEMIGATTITTPSNMPPYLKPYWGLYGAVPTGFEYYMPYFHTDWKQTSTSWGDIEGGGIFDIVTKLFEQEGILSTATKSLMVDKNVLGAYIERPKMYAYKGEEGPEMSFSITLLNTETEDDIIRNWHLCFMLAYQQLPNRTSKVLLEPPVIYEVEIPGLFYSPFAYISSLRITNRGATRVLEIPYYNLTENSEPAKIDPYALHTVNGEKFNTYSSDLAAKKNMTDGLWGKIVKAELGTKSGSTKTRTVETIIPDAYQIDITIRSLLPESKNLLYHSLLGAGTLGSGLYSAYVKHPGGEGVATDMSPTPIAWPPTHDSSGGRISND